MNMNALAGLRRANSPKISLYVVGNQWYASHPTLGTIRLDRIGHLRVPRNQQEALVYVRARWPDSPWEFEVLPQRNPLICLVGNPPKHRISREARWKAYQLAESLGKWLALERTREQAKVTPYGRAGVFWRQVVEALEEMTGERSNPPHHLQSAAAAIGVARDYLSTADAGMLTARDYLREHMRAEQASRARGARASIPLVSQQEYVRAGNPPAPSLRLPQRRVLGTISIEEARRRRVPGIEEAVARFRRFHGCDPSGSVTVYDDGRRDAVAGFLIGRAPEIAYDDVPAGSNKSGNPWVHKTSKRFPTYLAHVPLTEQTVLVGSMRVQDWLREKGERRDH